MAKKPTNNAKPINDGHITLGASWFFATIGIAFLALFGGAWKLHGMYDDSAVLVSSKVDKIATQNAEIQGQLKIILPYIQGKLAQQAAINPTEFGFETISTSDVKLLKAGWNVVDKSTALAFASEVKGIDSKLVSSFEEKNIILNCEEIAGDFQCSAIDSNDEFGGFTQWQEMFQNWPSMK